MKIQLQLQLTLPKFGQRKESPSCIFIKSYLEIEVQNTAAMDASQSKPSTELNTNSYYDLLDVLNNMPDDLKAIACDHLLQVAKHFLKSHSTAGSSTTVTSQFNLSSEETLEEEYHEAISEIGNDEKWKIESVGKLQVHWDQTADAASLAQTHFNTNQILNILKGSEKEANNDDTSNLRFENDFVNDKSLQEKPVNEEPDEDSQTEDDKNMHEDFVNEKVKAFHDRIGYSSFCSTDKNPSSSDKNNLSKTTNIPSIGSAMSHKKPQIDVPTEKKSEPLVPINSPSISVNNQKPVKLAEKSVPVCQPPKPKASAVINSIDFKTDSIFASSEFTSFFSDLNIRFASSSSTSDS